MAHHRWFVTAVAAAVLGGCSDASGEQTLPPVITVLAYNYAGVSADVLSAARNKVSVIFEKAGVSLLWAEPLSKAAVRGSAPAECQQPFSIQVMIRARQAEWEPGRKRIMGIALAADDARAVLSLFWDAVTDVALRSGSRRDDILAVALAHEMARIAPALARNHRHHAGQVGGRRHPPRRCRITDVQ